MKKITYKTSKRLSGYSTCFRQWNAKHSHCHFLHGYDLIFVLHFKAEALDHHHWVWDFGFLKNPYQRIDNLSIKEWFNYMFDHTVIIAEDDPEIEAFRDLAKKDLIQLRTVPYYSTEKIAEFILKKLNPVVKKHSNQRVELYKVEVWENQNNMGAFEIE